MDTDFLLYSVSFLDRMLTALNAIRRLCNMIGLSGWIREVFPLAPARRRDPADGGFARQFTPARQSGRLPGNSIRLQRLPPARERLNESDRYSANPWLSLPK
jgi:hypothetical protein